MGIPLAPAADRLVFFTYQSASIAFNIAKEAAQFIQASGVPKTGVLHDPLITSIIVHYGRPFKQRAPIRLSRDFVPPNALPLHDWLITLRDRVVAHTDIDGPVCQDGYLINELAGYTTNGSTRFGISIVTPAWELLMPHLNLLIARADKETDQIWARYFGKAKVPDGITIVNLADGICPFLLPHPILNKQN